MQQMTNFFMTLLCVLIYISNVKANQMYLCLYQQEGVGVNHSIFLFETQLDSHHVEVQQNVLAKIPNLRFGFEPSMSTLDLQNLL